MLFACLGTINIFLSRKHVPPAYLKVMKLSIDENELKLRKKEKKVKVNYPLFVKKSKSNMFKRAVKGDFKRKKKENKDKDKDDSIVIEESKEAHRDRGILIPLHISYLIPKKYLTIYRRTFQQTVFFHGHRGK